MLGAIERIWQGAISAYAEVTFSARVCSEGPESAHSVEKQRVTGAESDVQSRARAPFLSGSSRLLRRRKDLGQFPEVLGGGGEQEFVICAPWPA